jgi:hypothetical protein
MADRSGAVFWRLAILRKSYLDVIDCIVIDASASDETSTLGTAVLLHRWGHGYY